MAATSEPLLPTQYHGMASGSNTRLWRVACTAAVGSSLLTASMVYGVHKSTDYVMQQRLVVLEAAVAKVSAESGSAKTGIPQDVRDDTVDAAVEPSSSTKLQWAHVVLLGLCLVGVVAIFWNQVKRKVEPYMSASWFWFPGVYEEELMERGVDHSTYKFLQECRCDSVQSLCELRDDDSVLEQIEDIEQKELIKNFIVFSKSGSEEASRCLLQEQHNLRKKIAKREQCRDVLLVVQMVGVMLAVGACLYATCWLVQKVFVPQNQVHDDVPQEPTPPLRDAPFASVLCMQNARSARYLLLGDHGAVAENLSCAENAAYWVMLSHGADVVAVQSFETHEWLQEAATGYPIRTREPLHNFWVLNWTSVPNQYVLQSNHSQKLLCSDHLALHMMDGSSVGTKECQWLFIPVQLQRMMHELQRASSSANDSFQHQYAHLAQGLSAEKARLSAETLALKGELRSARDFQNKSLGLLADALSHERAARREVDERLNTSIVQGLSTLRGEFENKSLGLADELSHERAARREKEKRLNTSIVQGLSMLRKEFENKSVGLADELSHERAARREKEKRLNTSIVQGLSMLRKEFENRSFENKSRGQQLDPGDDDDSIL